MKNTLILLFFICHTLFSIAQEDCWVKLIAQDWGIEKMIKTNDGGYALLIFSYPEYGIRANKIVKCDSYGEIEWEKILSDNGNTNFKPFDFIQTQDGNYIISGYMHINEFNSCYILKVNEYGEYITSHYISYDNPNGYNRFVDVLEVPEIGYFAIGGAEESSEWFIHRYSTDLELIQIDSSEVFPSQPFNHIFKYTDNDLLLVKNYYSYMHYNKYIITDLNYNHKKEYTSYTDNQRITVDDKQNVILFDHYNEFHPGYLTKLNAELDSVWSYSLLDYTWNTIDYIEPKDIIPTSDNAFVFVNYFSNEVYQTISIVKFSQTGEVLWKTAFDNTNATHVCSVVEADDGGFVMLQGGNDYVWLVKVRPDGTLGNEEISVTSTEIIIYPNPVKDLLKINFPKFFSGTIQIYNQLGCLVESCNIANTRSFERNLSHLKSGLYYIQLIDNYQNTKYSQTIIKE